MARALAATLVVATLSLAACRSREAPPSPSASPQPSAAPEPSARPVASVPPVASATPALDPGAAAAPPWNVILLTIDSLRADMPWSGYERPIAPRLTELEKRAVSYTRAYAVSSYTSMSLGGMLAGRYPGELDRDGYFFGTYPKRVLFFPEVLQEAHVRTLGVQGHGYFKRGGAGFDQGFDDWRIVPNLRWNANTDENVTGPQMESIAEELLGDPARTAGKFFFWAHFLDPHDMYRPHADVPAWGRKARDLYDGEVTFADRYVGKLLDFIAAQPWAARTAIVVSADHGEVFGEHGIYRHGFELWQPLVHIPWMFVLPGVAARHVDTPRSHIDMARTLLDLLGVPAPDAIGGTSLVPELLGRAPAEPRDVLLDLPRTSDNDRRRALVHGDEKVIALGDDAYFQSFDVAADPGEEHPLDKTDRARHDALVARYRAAKGALHDVGPFACRKLKGAPEGRGY